MSTTENMPAVMYSNTKSLAQAVQGGLMEVKVLGSQDYYECRMCRRVMSGSVPAQSHLQGIPHMKILRNYMSTLNMDASLNALPSAGAESASHPVLPKGNEPVPSFEQSASAPSSTSSGSAEIDTVESAMKSGIVTEQIVSPLRVLTCTLCNITCTGDVPMIQHLSGEPHNKKKRKMNLPDSTIPVVSSLAADSFSIHSNLSHVVLPTPCIPVQTQDSLNSDDTVKSAIENGIVTHAVVGDTSHLTCEICHSSCTGRTPMKQHLQGNAHQKRMKAKNFLADPQQRIMFMPLMKPDIVQNVTPNSPVESSSDAWTDFKSAKDGGIVIETDIAFMCVVCNISCTGVVPVIEHLNGEAHHKKLRARGSLERSQQRAITPPRNPYNTVQNVTSSPMQNSSDGARDVLNSAKDKGIVLEAGNAFQCLICDISCTDVALATDHLNGEAHHKKLRNQMEHQQLMLKTPPVKDSTSPCADFPPRDGKSNETSLSSDTGRSIPDVVAVSDPHESVSRPVGSITKEVGRSSNTSVYLPKSASGILVYNANDSLDNLFE